MDGKLALVSDIMVINLSGDQQLTFVFFLPTTGHGMVAVGSVGSGSCVIGFPIARLVSETLLATCGIPLGISLCLDTVLCGYVIWA